MNGLETFITIIFGELVLLIIGLAFADARKENRRR